MANAIPSTASLPPAKDAFSPVSRTSTFPHKTSSAAAIQTRLIDTNTAAINAQPVELDGIPTSPEELKRRETGGSTNARGFISPADGADIDAEFLGEGGKGGGQIGREVCCSRSNTQYRSELTERQRRAEILASRSKDPGVIVDVPREPTAGEVEAARSGDRIVTPGLDTPATWPER
jgi:hypothetical protein